MNFITQKKSQTTQKRGLWLKTGFLLLIAAILFGCDGPKMTENDQMEVAEKAYQEGNYTKAIDLYEDFLKHYQNSPLAPVARQRIRVINREVSTVMRRKGSPSPEYVQGGQP